MLQQLHITNYALIEDMDIVFDGGFSVITGETGAGKSILLGALGFVLGDRADTNVLYDNEKKCVVEARFLLHDETLKTLFETNDLDFDKDCTMRRELSPNKKTRAFINDTPVTLLVMKSIGSQLVDIHSQHDSLLLVDADFQMHLLDEIAQDAEILASYEQTYKQYNDCKQQLHELKTRAAKNAAENDFIAFQLEELEKANLHEDEYSEIGQTLQVMENAEEIKKLLARCNMLLNHSEYAILQQISELESSLHHLRSLLPDTEGLSDRVANLKIELKDIAYDLERKESSTQFDETQLLALQERFDLINRLMMKHRVNDFNALTRLRDLLSEQVNAFANIDHEIEIADKALNTTEKELAKIAKALHEKRKTASTLFEERVTETARLLAMPHATFKVHIDEAKTYLHNGTDSVRFLFSANKGIEVNDIGRVASGGELSRIMLAIKSVVSKYNYIPTLIFDEIDTGVSGEVAAKIGDIMNEMGQTLQLTAITHLPQVASKAQKHYFIFKDNIGEKAKTGIKRLDHDERIREIAKMLSNDRITEEALRAAEVLLPTPKTT